MVATRFVFLQIEAATKTVLLTKTVVLVQVMRASCYDTYTTQVEPVMKLGRGGKHRTLSRSGASIHVLGGDLHYVAQVVQRMALMTMVTMMMMMMSNDDNLKLAMH